MLPSVRVNPFAQNKNENVNNNVFLHMDLAHLELKIEPIFDPTVLYVIVHDLSAAQFNARPVTCHFVCG